MKLAFFSLAAIGAATSTWFLFAMGSIPFAYAIGRSVTARRSGVQLVKVGARRVRTGRL